MTVDTQPARRRTGHPAGRCLAATVGIILCLLAPRAHADEIRMLASAAMKEAFLELIPEFEKSSGHKVVTLWAGGVDIVKRIKAGEIVDLVVLARPAVEGLIKEGKVAPGGRVDLANSGVGVAVRVGAPRPDISSGEALKRALLSAKQAPEYRTWQRIKGMAIEDVRNWFMSIRRGVGAASPWTPLLFDAMRDESR